MGEAHVEPAHDVAGIGDAGQEGNAALDRRLAQIFGEAGRDDEFRPGLERRVERLRIDHGTSTDDRAFDLLHRGDRFERGGGAQRHLEHLETARDQRLGHRHRIGDIVDDDHRDDRRGPHDGFDRDCSHAAFSWAKAAAAPNRPGWG